MNKTALKEKESYEAPVILDIKPVSVAGLGTDSNDDIMNDPNETTGTDS